MDLSHIVLNKKDFSLKVVASFSWHEIMWFYLHEHIEWWMLVRESVVQSLPLGFELKEKKRECS